MKSISFTKLYIYATALLLSFSCVSKKNIIPTQVEYNNSNNPKVELITPSFISAKLNNYEISSEYFPAKAQNERIRFLILHYTACDMKTSVELLTKSEVSSHYLVSDSLDKKIHLLVTEDKRAWHAGKSFFKGSSNLNDNSIGIEIVNKGYLLNPNSEFAKFPEHQIEKVISLSKDIIERYKIDPTFVLGHADIAPQRKYDPGPYFPWKKLFYDYGIGAWYDEDVKSEFKKYYSKRFLNLPEFIKTVQSDLLKYGYEIEITGRWDQQTKNVIRVFQYHFRPENYSGIIDAETWAILQALNYKYRNDDK